MEKEVLSTILSILPKNPSDIGTIGIMCLIFFVWHSVTIRQIKDLYSSGDCLGKVGLCKSRIVRKCMILYDRVSMVIIAESSESYIRDLEDAARSGEITITQDEKDRIITKHKKVLSMSFLAGKFYIHDTVVANDFDKTYIEVDGVQIYNPQFLILCENILDTYYSIVWDTYGEMFTQAFYKLDYHKRRIEFMKNRPRHLKIMIDMMTQFNILMGK